MCSGLSWVFLATSHHKCTDGNTGTSHPKDKVWAWAGVPQPLVTPTWKRMHLVVLQCPPVWPSLTPLPSSWAAPLPPAPEIVPVLVSMAFTGRCYWPKAPPRNNPQLRVRNLYYVKQPQMWGVNTHCSSLRAVRQGTKGQTGSWVPWTLHTDTWNIWNIWNHSSTRGGLQQLAQREMRGCCHVEQASVGEALHTDPAGGKAAVQNMQTLKKDAEFGGWAWVNNI